MHKAHTSRVIEQFSLITGAVSKEMLRRAIDLRGRRKRQVAIPTDDAALERLRAIYTQYLPRCLDVDPAPRYLPFYLALKDQYPDLRWKISSAGYASSPRRRQVVLHLPRIQGVLPSLAALLLQDLPINEMHMNKRMSSELSALPSRVRGDFVDLLESSHAVMPKREILHDMAGLLSKGLAGEALVAICPVCPDYAAEATDNPNEPYRYTFKGIGEGIGLVAGRLLEDLPRYSEFFRHHNIDVRYLVAQGDFEGFSPETLASVGVSKAEFLRRLKESGKLLNSRLRGLPARSVFFTDFCGGEEGWSSLHTEMTAQIQKLRNKPHQAPDGIDWDQILTARRPLYERWVGRHQSLEAYLPFLIYQAAEYAAMGEIAHRVSANSFLLCCDHSAMAPFYKVPRGTPVIYLKRNYS